MVIQKKSSTELEIRQKLEESEQNLRAVYGIKELLTKIDHSSEVVPLSNADRLILLLTSLKGNPLDKMEISVANELARF